MNYILPQEIANEIVNYLVKQPYEEVTSIIEQLKTLKTANIVTPQEDTQPPTEGGDTNVQSTEPKSEENASVNE